jgi:hypothetical protein
VGVHSNSRDIDIPIIEWQDMVEHLDWPANDHAKRPSRLPSSLEMGVEAKKPLDKSVRLVDQLRLFWSAIVENAFQIVHGSLGPAS